MSSNETLPDCELTQKTVPRKMQELADDELAVAAVKPAQTTLTTFKGPTRSLPDQRRLSGRSVAEKASLKGKLCEANSLESVSSRSSNSSATTELPNRPEGCPAPRSVIGTRIVSPPKLAHEDSTTTLTDKSPQAAVTLKQGQLAQSAAFQGPPQPRPNDDRPPSGSQRESGPKPPFMFAGLLASVASSFFFSLNVLCIKLLPSGEEEGFQEKTHAVFWRGVFLMFFCTITILYQRSNFKLPHDEIWVNLLRAVFGTVGSIGIYCALNYISMGDASALIFSSPIWTSLLSYFILGEPLRWITFLALPATMLGIVLIAHPSLIVNVDHLLVKPADQMGTDNMSMIIANINSTLDHFPAATTEEAMEQYLDRRWPGIVIALGTSLLVSFTYIVLKFRKNTPIQTTTFWLGACMTSVAGIIVLIGGSGSTPYTSREWLLLSGNGISSWIAQSLLQWAFLHEEAGVLSVVRTLDVALSFVLSALFLDDEIYWTSVVGAAIIGFVVVSYMLNNYLAKKHDTQQVEKKPPELPVAVSAILTPKELEANASQASASNQVGHGGPEVYRIDKIV